jgi:hypothetical protein
MTSLIPRGAGSLSTGHQAPDGFSRTESKELARLQNRELTRGLVTATNLQAKGFVTMVGVQLVGTLSREAEFQHGGDPRVAERVNLLVDQFTMAAANEIGRM